MKRIRKAVIPVAGLGTRMLPATKVVPKELIPLVDVPSIQIVVEECAAAGIEQIVLVTARGKEAIADHFDRSFDLETALERQGRTRDLDLVRKLSTMVEIVSVRQQEPRGLGHAIHCARPAVGDEPFAVLLGDDLVEAERPGILQLLDVAESTGQGVVGLQEVPAGQEHLYGIVDGERTAPSRWKIRGLVEKPRPGSAPSRLAIIGRYVLPPSIFDILAVTPPGRGGEIQLTDGLATLCARSGLSGVEVAGRRFDAGDRVGYVLATLYYALRRPDIGEDVRAGARRMLEEPGGGLRS